jgi:hypothetical protein
MGNSTGSSNEGTSYNAGTGSTSGTGVTNSSGASLGNSTDGDDFSATAKGAAMAGTAGAAVGRAVDGVQNTADHAAHAVTGQPYDSSRGTNMSGMFRPQQRREGLPVALVAWLRQRRREPAHVGRNPQNPLR